MSETSTLHLFNGTREAFQLFCLKYKDLAKLASVHCPRGQGLLRFLLSKAEFTALAFPPGIVAGSFVPLPYPQEEPILAANPTALQVSISNAHSATWRYSNDQFISQLSEANKFKATLLGALDPTTQQDLNGPITGFQNVTPAQIHAHLLNVYGVLSPTDLAAVKARLAVP